MRALSLSCVIAIALASSVSNAELKPGASGVSDGARGSDAAINRRATQFKDIKGQQWTLERLRGRVVLLDFWATWCAPCLAELPRLRELRARHAREDFEIIGVMLDTTTKRALVSWLNRHRIDWPQIHERGGYSGALPRAYGVEYLPATVLFRRDGTIEAKGLRGELLARRVEELLQ